MSKSIPLIHKAAAITQIEALKPYIKDIWPIVHYSKLPIYLDSTSAQFIPFRAFSRLLQAAFEQLPHQAFIAFIQRGATSYSKQIAHNSKQNNKVNSLARLADLLPIERVSSKHSTLSKHHSEFSLAFTLEDVEPFNFVGELYAISVAHSYLIQQRSDIKKPSKYHLVSQDKSGLDKLSISTDTPQFMGQTSIALFYPSTVKQHSTTLDLHWEKQVQPFSIQASCALESYIGRQDLRLEDFSDIIKIPTRTIQRHLAQDGTSFRQIKESLNIAFAKRVMKQRNVSISEISAHLGYAEPSQFIRAFKKSENITPLQWSKKHD